jgi:hypothetical protein
MKRNLFQSLAVALLCACAEAYLANNERELAIKNYKKSLELTPQNTNARDVLKKIEQQK